MEIITLCLLLVLQGTLARVYRASCIAHPGTWFVVAWLSAYACYDLAVWLKVPLVGEVYDPDLRYLLYTCVGTTALGFLIAILFYHPTQERRLLPYSEPPTIAHPLFWVFAAAAVSAALLNWVASGADLSGMESRRETYLKGGRVLIKGTLFLYVLCFPTALLAGWNYCTRLLAQQCMRTHEWVCLCLPLVAGVFWTLSTGGRQALGIVLLYYSVGLALSFVLRWRLVPRPAWAGIGRRALLSCGILAALFAAFVEFTGAMREAHQFGSVNELGGFRQYWCLAPFSQFIEYTAVPMAAFQANCNPDTAGQNNIGRETFGVLRFLHLSSFLGWEYVSGIDLVDEHARWAKRGYVMTNATTSMYYDVVTDFGDIGGIVAGFLMAIISHWIYVQWLMGNWHTYALRHVPLVMAIMFWGYSHQFSMLKEDLLFWMVLSFLAWDLGVVFFGSNELPQHRCRQIGDLRLGRK